MKKGTFFFVIGLLLLAAALALIAYNVWDNSRAGKAADNVLMQLLPLIDDDSLPAEEANAGGVDDPSAGSEEIPFTGSGPDETEYPDNFVSPDAEMPVRTVDGKEYVGVISVPSINCLLPIFSEWNNSNLATAPCRYSGSAYLDNMVICGHNYRTQFGSLKNLNYGDAVIFTDVDGNTFKYQVMEIETLQPTAIGEMTDSDWDLTLFTCTVGGATRVTVRCERAAS